MQGHPEHRPNTRRRSGDIVLAVAIRVVWALIAAGIILTLGFTFYPEWNRLSCMKKDLAEQQGKLADLKKKTADHEQEVKLLQTDPQYLETIARDKLDVMKDGETIFRFPTNQPQQ